MSTQPDNYGLTYHFISARNAVNAAMNCGAIDDLEGQSQLFYLRDELDKAAVDTNLTDEAITLFKDKAIEYTKRSEVQQ